jgi:hypothetical protein
MSVTAFACKNKSNPLWSCFWFSTDMRFYPSPCAFLLRQNEMKQFASLFLYQVFKIFIRNFFLL